MSEETTPKTYTQEEMDAEIKKYKELVSKANSEAKGYKDKAKEAEEKYNSTLSEAELAQKKKEEELATLKANYESVIRENKVGKLKAQFKELHYSDERAAEAAEAFLNGDADRLFATASLSHTDFEQAIRANNVKANPHPDTGGSGQHTLTKKEILAEKDYSKRMKLISENLELFT